MAELFQTTPPNITLHLKSIYAEGELAEEATCKEYLQVRSEGGREVISMPPADNLSVTLQTIGRAAQAIGKRLHIELV